MQNRWGQALLIIILIIFLVLGLLIVQNVPAIRDFFIKVAQFLRDTAMPV